MIMDLSHMRKKSSFEFFLFVMALLWALFLSFQLQATADQGMSRWQKDIELFSQSPLTPGQAALAMEGKGSNDAADAIRQRNKLSEAANKATTLSHMVSNLPLYVFLH